MRDHGAPRSAMASPSSTSPFSCTSSTATKAEYSTAMHFAARVELVRILLGPPVGQVALGVEMAAFVVEAVRLSWPMTTPMPP